MTVTGVRRRTGEPVPDGVSAVHVTDRLNELGAEGWELVSVFDTNNGGSTLEVVAVLKRPLQ